MPLARVEQGEEELASIGDDPEPGREVEPDDGGVDVHVDQLRVRVDQPVRVGDEAAELRPDRQDHVGVAERGVGVVAGVAADAAERQLVRLGQAALAGAAGHDRDPEPLGDPAERVVRTGLVDPVAGEDDRAIRGREGEHDGLRVGRARRGPVERHLERLLEHGGLVVVGDVHLEQVAGDPEVDRAGRPAERVPGRLADEARDLGRDRRLDPPLRDRREHRGLVELLVLLAGAIRPAHRRGHRDDRAARPERLRHAPGDVRRARPVGAVDEARPAADPGVRVGHVDGRRLGSRQDLADALGLEGDPQLVVAAGHQEEVLDPEGLELLGDGGSRRDRRGRRFGRLDGRARGRLEDHRRGGVGGTRNCDHG